MIGSDDRYCFKVPVGTATDDSEVAMLVKQIQLNRLDDDIVIVDAEFCSKLPSEGSKLDLFSNDVYNNDHYRNLVLSSSSQEKYRAHINDTSLIQKVNAAENVSIFVQVSDSNDASVSDRNCNDFDEENEAGDEENNNYDVPKIVITHDIDNNL